MTNVSVMMGYIYRINKLEKRDCAVFCTHKFYQRQLTEEKAFY